MAAARSVFPPAHLRRHDVVMHRFEVEEAGGHLAVKGNEEPYPAADPGGLRLAMRYADQNELEVIGK